MRLILLDLLFLSFSLIPSVSCAQWVVTADQPDSRAAQFTQLFDRSQGWLGADGIYSIALDGNDQWGSAHQQTTTLFVFSDSLLGTADPATDKFNDVRMVNHSAAILTHDDAAPQKDSIQFIFGKQGSGTRSNIFDKKYWLQDGIVIDNKLYLTGFLPNAKWKPTQVDLLTIPLLSSTLPDWQHIAVTEQTSLFAENDQCLVMFGIGILDHAATDGFIYVYGYCDHTKTQVKHLVAARVKPESFAKMDQWRFWNGNTWSPNLKEVFREEAALADRVSTELSVTPVEKDRFVLVFVQDVMSGKIAYKVGRSPIGPFGPTVVFYEAPERKTLGRGIYVYNAKAHPHLSSPESLLISYNVNRLGGLPHNTNEYRPRFIELPKDQIKMNALSSAKSTQQ